MERLSFIAFAAAYRRVGIVYVVGDDVRHWKISCSGGRDCDGARKLAQNMIDRWQPDVVVTERTISAVHKSPRTKAITAAIARVAEDKPMLNIAIERQNDFKNKYEEAAHLVGKHPQLAVLRPKPRRLFDPEPRSTVVFEALSLIESVKRGPTQRLAAAMG